MKEMSPWKTTTHMHLVQGGGGFSSATHLADTAATGGRALLVQVPGQKRAQMLLETMVMVLVPGLGKCRCSLSFCLF